MVSDDRGQGHTLEGITAALLVVSSIAFALQVTAVTPLTASTASQHVETQYRSATDGLLAHAAANGAIKHNLLYWNSSEAGFHGSSVDGYYIGEGPPTDFGDELEATYSAVGVAFNVDISYITDDGGVENRRFVYYGQPSDTAVTASRSVVLYDTDQTVDGDGFETGNELEDTAYFAPDAFDGHLYNVVTVEVTIWRM